MRDLYKRIGLNFSANAEEIRTIIKTVNDQRLKKDVETILLNPDNRKEYDQVHQVLSKIGYLRAQLGLNHAENWTGSESIDFSRTDIRHVSVYEKLEQKVKILTKKRWLDNPVLKLIIAVIRPFSGILIIIALIFGISFISDLGNDEKPNKPSPSKPTHKSQIPVFNQPEMALPYTGEIKSYTNNERIAPFAINTEYGANYLVKLTSVYSNKDVLTVFVRGGDDIQIDVPLGKYIIKYAAGEKWYGYKYRFGPYTSYSKSDEIFNFKVFDNQISGYSVTLYNVINGNLETYSIDESDF